MHATQPALETFVGLKPVLLVLTTDCRCSWSGCTVSRSVVSLFSVGSPREDGKCMDTRFGKERSEEGRAEQKSEEGKKHSAF